MIISIGQFGNATPASTCVEIELFAESGGEYTYIDCKGANPGWAALSGGQSIIICAQPKTLIITGGIIASILGPC